MLCFNDLAAAFLQSPYLSLVNHHRKIARLHLECGTLHVCGHTENNHSAASASNYHSFLSVDEYVVQLYDKYGEGGGMLSKKTFAQVSTVYRCIM